MLTLRNGKLVEIRRSKFNNRKTMYRGTEYDSQREAHRAMELDAMVANGLVSAWVAQPEFEFTVNGVKICSYFPDFRVTYPDGRVEYEDVKGVQTDVFKLKKKMLEAFYGIKVKIVK